MHGASGAGKTCTQLLLLNEPPPQPPPHPAHPAHPAHPDSVPDSTNEPPPPKLVPDSTNELPPPTVSTPIACPAVKATRISIDNDNEKMKWKKVTPAELLEQLASELEKAPKVVSQTSVEEASEETRTHEQNEREGKPLQKEPTDATKKVLEDISEKIPYAREAKLSTNWAYFIDSGGQPAYRELLPLFSRTAALNIITIDLTKGLDEKYGSEYRIGGENLPINTELKYSNLDIIRSTISSEAILKPIEVPYVTNPPSHPHYLVVGTRKKEVEEKDINSMNQTLKKSNLNLQHVIWKIPQKSIIFPVDTLLPAGSKEREEASVELCTVISNCNVSMKIKMPIRLFVFEIALLEEAEKKKQSFLKKKKLLILVSVFNLIVKKKRLRKLFNIYTTLPLFSIILMFYQMSYLLILNLFSIFFRD